MHEGSGDRKRGRKSQLTQLTQQTAPAAPTTIEKVHRLIIPARHGSIHQSKQAERKSKMDDRKIVLGKKCRLSYYCLLSSLFPIEFPALFYKLSCRMYVRLFRSRIYSPDILCQRTAGTTMRHWEYSYEMSCRLTGNPFHYVDTPRYWGFLNVVFNEVGPKFHPSAIPKLVHSIHSWVQQE